MSSEQSESATEQWSASNPPTLYELGEAYALTLAVWGIPLLVLTGLLDDAVRLFVAGPLKVITLGMEQTLEAIGVSGSVDTTSAQASESASTDDLSPGGFVIVAALQIGLALFAIGLMIILPLVALAVGLAYIVSLVYSPVRAYRGTVAYYRSKRGGAA